MAVTGTSCVTAPAVDGFVVEDGRLFARVSHGPYSIEGQPLGTAEWAVSSDGGHRWVRADAAPGVVSVAQTSCAAARCWRVVPGRAVEEQAAPAQWREVFAFTPRQREAMRERLVSGCDRAEDQFRAIATVEGAGGTYVVVAMGSQGVLRLGPDGSWTRRPVLDRRPVRTDGAPWVGRLVGAPLFVALLVPVVFVVGRRRGHGRRGARAATLAVAGGAAAFALAVSQFFGADFTLVGPAVGVVSVTVFVASVVVALRPAKPQPEPGGWPPPAPQD